MKILSILNIGFITLIGTALSKDLNLAEVLSKSSKANHFELISSNEGSVQTAYHELEQSQDNVYKVNLNLQQAGVFTIGNNSKLTFDLRVSINTDYIVVVGNECISKCDMTTPYRKSDSQTWDVIQNASNVNLTTLNVFDYFTYPTLRGDMMTDRICIKDEKCQVSDKKYPQPSFLYLREYNNSFKPLQRFDQSKYDGFIGLMPASPERDPTYKIQSFPQYLKDRAFIKQNAFSLYKNFKGGNSVLQIGFFDEKMHANNYTLNFFPNKNMSLYAFEALDVTLGNFTLQAQIGTQKKILSIVDNHFPYILIESTDPLAGDYFQGNMSDGIEDEGILFRQYEGIDNSYQAYFPLTDCADVAIKFKEEAIRFISNGNFRFEMIQGMFKQESDTCVNQLVFISNSTEDLMILGKPFLANSNITINYDTRIIGLSNGKDLNPVKINYIPRVLILVITFSLIAGALGLLGKQLRPEQKEEEEEEEEYR